MFWLIETSVFAQPPPPLFKQEGFKREENQPFQPLHRQPVPSQPFQPQTLPLLPQETLQQPDIPVSPGISVVTPSAYGATWGDVGVGMGLQGRTRFSDRSDGVLGIKVGLGNPREILGAEIGLTLVDLDAPLSGGGVNVKVHRQLSETLALAFGVAGVTNFGETDGGSSIYGVVTGRFSFSDNTRQAHLSLGVGGGQFRSESEVVEGVNGVGVFGSGAIQLTPQTSAIAEWTGQDITLGFSVVPFPDVPLVVVPALTDITGTAGDGVRLIFSTSYSLEF
ncbi:hypothetical protein PN462_12950 [Spirulina sp. CS-785/01]|uniref:hypothetical protein n=1 Tax=Spirulina sp. CS-785/01 TaxID=3021716 RepID=UPI00232E8808|nr:hypothetical protein [Spirulina sp. CS-785/01]MDB9314014.1 hypothetical protein [Spirulina sp. CS-785/01]